MNRTLLIGALVLICGLPSVGQQSPDGTLPAPQHLESRVKEIADQIMAVDEPALRVFLRLQVATFLWQNKDKLDSIGAEALATEALADLKDHEIEIPPLYVNVYRRDLQALVELHAPAQAARLNKLYGAQQGNGGQQIDTAYSMLGSERGTAQAVEKVRGLIKNGQDTGTMLLFFLHRLKQESPTELPHLLTEILAAEGRKPDAIITGDLYQLASFYLYDEVPTELKVRFLNLAVRATRGSAAWQEPKQIWDSYNLLRIVTPVVEKLQPSLYAQASAQLASLTPRVPRSELEREEAEKRIRQSSDPLSEMISEAGSTKDASFKEQLLVDAAQLALKKGEVKLATDLIIQAKSEDKEGSLYRDQFLGEVVAKAIEQADKNSALYAASKMGAPLKHASALVKIGYHLFEKQDLEDARKALDEALKRVEDTEDNAAKVTALLQLSAVYTRVDNARIPELTKMVVKIVNNIPSPQSENKPDTEAHRKYVSELLQIAYYLIPVFRLLAEDDEIGTVNLVDKIQPREIRVAAAFGASTNKRALGTATTSAKQVK